MAREARGHLHGNRPNSVPVVVRHREISWHPKISAPRKKHALGRHVFVGHVQVEGDLRRGRGRNEPRRRRLVGHRRCRCAHEQERTCRQVRRRRVGVVDFDRQAILPFHQHTLHVQFHKVRRTPRVQNRLVPGVEHLVPHQHLPGLPRVSTRHLDAIDVRHKAVVVIHSQDGPSERAGILKHKRVPQIDAWGGRNLRRVVTISIPKARRTFVPAVVCKIPGSPIPYRLKGRNQILPRRAILHHGFPVVHGSLRRPRNRSHSQSRHEQAASHMEKKASE